MVVPTVCGLTALTQAAFGAPAIVQRTMAGIRWYADAHRDVSLSLLGVRSCRAWVFEPSRCRVLRFVACVLGQSICLV